MDYIIIASISAVFFSVETADNYYLCYVIFTNLAEFGYFVGILQLQWM